MTNGWRYLVRSRERFPMQKLLESIERVRPAVASRRSLARELSQLLKKRWLLSFAHRIKNRQ